MSLVWAEQKWLLHLPIISRAEQTEVSLSGGEVNGALARDSLEREKSSIPFDSDFIYLENWNLPPPPSFPGELFKSLSLSLSLLFINPSLALARRPEASRSSLSLSSLFAPFFGVGVGGVHVGGECECVEIDASRFIIRASKAPHIERRRHHTIFLLLPLSISLSTIAIQFRPDLQISRVDMHERCAIPGAT